MTTFDATPPPPPPPVSIPPSPNASTQAITALIVGILGFVSCCYLLSPVAWYLGSQELKSIREGRSAVAGEPLAKVGWILGIVGSILLVLSLIWLFFMGGLMVLAGLRAGR